MKQEIEYFLVKLSKPLKVLGILNLEIHNFVYFLAGSQGVIISLTLLLFLHVQKFGVVGNLHINDAHFLTVTGKNFLKGCLL